MLVISPQTLEGALREFVDWKKSLQDTQWLALEDVLRQSPGADDPEKLKQSIYAQWQTRKIGYVLLVGDVDVLPVRYMVLDRKTSAAFDYAFHEPCLDRDGKAHQGTDRGEQFTAPPLPPAPLQPGAVNPTCLGEQLLKQAGTGGVAYIGCNTGSQPFGLTLVEGFIRELAAAPSPRLGDCWNSALRHYVSQQKLRELKPTESWVPPRIFFQGMKFMVFGDPSLHLPADKKPLPPARDLRQAFEKAGLTPRHQGHRGTCSVFAVTAALEFALADSEPPTTRLSVEYLNWASNQVVGRAVDGGFFSDLWKGYLTWGICQESEMPYAAGFDPTSQPAPVAMDHAKQRLATPLRLHWIKPWNVRTGLTPDELAAIRQTLADGNPVCGGLRWPKREQWQQSLLQIPPPADVFDGHSVLLVGYQADAAQPGGGTFLFYNPNRPNQECRMSWEYARAYMNDAMWIEPTERKPTSIKP